MFIEKPISNNLEDFLKFKKLAKKKNSLILVGYVLRYSKILNEYKKLIAKNIIGSQNKVTLFHEIPRSHLKPFGFNLKEI